MTAPADPRDPPLAETGKRTTDAAGATHDAAASPGDARSNPDDNDDEWRHAPVAPVDEPNPLKSLGQAVADTLTNADAETPRQPKR